MYDIIKNVINRNDFELSDMLSKIDKLWAEGRLTDAQREELSGLARGGARAVNSVDIYVKLSELEKRVRELEKLVRKLENGETTTDTTNEAYEYISGKWYYTGDTCSFEGVDYICVAPEGMACVWSPKDYPTYWEVITNA